MTSNGDGLGWLRRLLERANIIRLLVTALIASGCWIGGGLIARAAAAAAFDVQFTAAQATDRLERSMLELRIDAAERIALNNTSAIKESVGARLDRFEKIMDGLAGEFRVYARQADKFEGALDVLMRISEKRR